MTTKRFTEAAILLLLILWGSRRGRARTLPGGPVQTGGGSGRVSYDAGTKFVVQSLQRPG